MADNQLDHELEIFITQQQHLHNTTIALTIHQLTLSTSTSESSIHSTNTAPTRAHRVFKRKQPNPISQLLISHPRSSRIYALHQRHKTNVDKSRPQIVPQDYIQPIEITILEYIHNTN